MAKVNIEFDSQTKEFSVMIDGTELEDVKSVDIYKYNGEPANIHISRRKEGVDGFEICTTLYASQASTNYASKDKTLVNTEAPTDGVKAFLDTLKG